MKRTSMVLASVLCGVVGYTAAPQVAEACGGTFCDGGPQPMPVDQSGENILFVRSGDTIEAHIQIQYEGDAERFGWVIPLQSVPTFSVGSEPLFQALLQGTVPTYNLTTQRDDCSVGNGDGGDAFPGDGAGTSGAGSGGDSTGGEEPPGPNVVFMDTVGAYEITVLEGGTAEQVIQWLSDNGYQQDPEAEPILQAYLDEGHLFGAVKLTGGADVDEIHPIVLTFQGDEPCIPLRLTRIAAVEDMDIRSFFLGSERTVPQNYKHVLVNQVKIDWTPGNLATNYKEIITQAVDADMAQGRAFVTEYAGPSGVVPTFGVHSPLWDSAVFDTIEPIGVVDELMAQGLYFCDEFGGGCQGLHPLVQPILDEFLPVPVGVDPNAFYECLSCFQDEINLDVWDGPAFADAVLKRIVEPGQRAIDILAQNPYLTRMYTTISPGEMTADPMFHENGELPEVANNLTGTRRILCNGDSVYILPDGRQVYLPQGAPWPDFDSEPAWSMPSDEEVQEVMDAGAPVVLVNNTQAIDDALAAYNAAQGWAGADDGGGASSGAADGGEGSSGGCGCRSSGEQAPAGFALMLLGLGLGVMSRRQRLG